MKLISSALVCALSAASTEIVYLPEGRHEITATVDGKPKTIAVSVPPARGVQIAATLQAALAERQKSNVRPWFDFEHKRGVASALPKSFRYEPGKGVMCSLEWTGAGRAAIEGRDFSYFSPEFFLGDDGVPAGLPSKGPLGALVNEPAFREMPRIAASYAGGGYPGGETEFERRSHALVASGEASSIDDAYSFVAASDPDCYRDYMRSLSRSPGAPVQASAAPVPVDLLTPRAEALVAAGQARDLDAAIGMVCASDPDAYTAYCSAFYGQTEVHASEASSVNHAQGYAKLMARAETLVDLGMEKSMEQAMMTICASEPALYDSYLAHVSAGNVSG